MLYLLEYEEGEKSSGGVDVEGWLGNVVRGITYWNVDMCYVFS